MSWLGWIHSVYRFFLCLLGGAASSRAELFSGGDEAGGSGQKEPSLHLSRHGGRGARRGGAGHLRRLARRLRLLLPLRLQRHLSRGVVRTYRRQPSATRDERCVLFLITLDSEVFSSDWHDWTGILQGSYKKCKSLQICWTCRSFNKSEPGMFYFAVKSSIDAATWRF